MYQTDYITVSVDQEVSIYSNFESSYTAPPSFICGDGTEIDFINVNNNTVDCEDGADEQWYDSNTSDDTSDDCQKAVDEDCEGEPVNWFDCHDGSKSGFTKSMIGTMIVKTEKMNSGVMIHGIIGTEKFISLKVSTSTFLDTLT